VIGLLEGTLIYKQAPDLMLKVQGVGYELQAPMSTFYNLPECGVETVLYTHLLVREDAHTLYAFHSTEDRSLFRTLLKVNGVGAKMALAILSGMETKGFRFCIENGDVDALIRLPGVGRKTAERLVVELRDRLSSIGTSDGIASSASSVSSGNGLSLREEAITALTTLGYKGPEATRMVNQVESETESSEELIRLALKTSLKK